MLINIEISINYKIRKNYLDYQINFFKNDYYYAIMGKHLIIFNDYKDFLYFKIGG